MRSAASSYGVEATIWRRQHDRDTAAGSRRESDPCRWARRSGVIFSCFVGLNRVGLAFLCVRRDDVVYVFFHCNVGLRILEYIPKVTYTMRNPFDKTSVICICCQPLTLGVFVKLQVDDSVYDDFYGILLRVHDENRFSILLLHHANVNVPGIAGFAGVVIFQKLLEMAGVSVPA